MGSEGLGFLGSDAVEDHVLSRLGTRAHEQRGRARRVNGCVGVKWGGDEIWANCQGSRSSRLPVQKKGGVKASRAGCPWGVRLTYVRVAYCALQGVWSWWRRLYGWCGHLATRWRGKRNASAGSAFDSQLISRQGTIGLVLPSFLLDG